MRSLKALLALLCVEGFAAVLWTFLTPSEGGHAVFLWLSRERIALFGLALLLWAASLGLSLRLWFYPSSLEAAHAWLDGLCLIGKQLGSLLIFLAVVPLSLLAALLAVVLTPPEYAVYRTLAPDTFPLLHSVVLGLLPILLFLILASLESAVYLGIHYRRALATREMWSWSRIGPALLGLCIAVLTVFYWLVLVFQLRFFVNNPAWYWKFEFVPFNSGDFVFLCVSLVLVFLAWWTLIVHRRILIGLLLLFMLGVFLQFGVGLMAGAGLASFQDRYFSSYHKTYISKAAQSTESILDSVSRYELLYGSRLFTNTKPPGLMAFYIALDHLLNGHPSSYSPDARYARLSGLVSYVYPLVAMGLIFATYAFARRYAPGRLDLVPVVVPFILAVCPNLVLFSLFPDQAIYPLFFLLGVVFIIITVRRQSVILAFLLGLFLYLMVFFAFTMLPLYPFALIYLALNDWHNRDHVRLGRAVWMAVALLAGTLLLYFAFRLFLNYDFLPRFEKTVLINHNFDFYLRVHRPIPTTPESFSTRLQQIIAAAWLNNVDFAAAVGFPVYLLFLVGAVRLLSRLFKRDAGPSDIILAALLFSFVVLILAGTAQGEVPRLWLFWLPWVVLLAALELESFAQRQPRMLLVLATVQIISIFLTFHFQDLRM